jgi:hypothetical protein
VGSMNGDHITVVFTTRETVLQFPCPTGADHMDEVPVQAYACAWCLCGWAFVDSFLTTGAYSVDVAHTLLKMVAREHMNTTQEDPA